MKTLYEFIGAVIAMHQPEAQNAPMVYSVWEDGEITSEKGADLFGMRNMHLVAYGDPDMAFPSDSLPIRNSYHSRILVGTREQANIARALIISR